MVSDQGENELGSEPPTDVGDYAVKVVVARTSRYSGGFATVDFTISPKPITLTAQDAAIVYDDMPTNNGLQEYELVGEDTLDGELKFAYDYEQFGAVGTYKITPSGLSSPNYDITFKDGTLTVSPKQLDLEWTQDRDFIFNPRRFVKPTRTAMARSTLRTPPMT